MLADVINPKSQSISRMTAIVSNLDRRLLDGEITGASHQNADFKHGNTSALYANTQY